MHLFFNNNTKKGWINKSITNRVLRGGNWNNNANNLRCSKRNNNNPNNTNNNNGFRIVNTCIARIQLFKDNWSEQISTNLFLLEKAKMNIIKPVSNENESRLLFVRINGRVV